jgi:hypothetical protein
MAKRKAARAGRSAGKGRKQSRRRSSAKRPSSAKRGARAAKKGARKAAAPARSRRPASRKPARKAAPKKASLKFRPAGPAKVPRLDRDRRILNDDVVPTPPSSLNMDRHGSAARTGRAEYTESQREHRGMNDLSGGDVDVDVEDAFFTGEEAPGGDNPTPDQDIVDDIGKALGVEYEDNEELKGADKIGKRDKHRWELDPASSEDYKDRD